MPALDSFRLDGKVAIVTGASSGLGVAIALALAEAGADVAVCARRADQLAQTGAMLAATGRRALAVPADVSDPVQCRRVVSQTVQELGGLDILVNNAGVGRVVPALKQTHEDFREVLDINLGGAHWMACAAAESMDRSGSIVNVASLMGITPTGSPQAAYAASKAGMLGLTRDLAQEWGRRRGIRVNAVAPGFFATEMTEGYRQIIEDRIDRAALGRIGEAEELAHAVLFLASPAASYVTGATLVVDGAFSLG